MYRASLDLAAQFRAYCLDHNLIDVSLGLELFRKVLCSNAKFKKAFEPRVPGGAAKPEIWSKWPDFSKRLDVLTAATEALSKTAKDGGVAATSPTLQAVLTCKGCHDTYRVPKK